MGHRFTTTTYTHPTFCAVCRSMILGLVRQGWDCIGPCCPLSACVSVYMRAEMHTVLIQTRFAPSGFTYLLVNLCTVLCPPPSPPPPPPLQTVECTCTRRTTNFRQTFAAATRKCGSAAPGRRNRAASLAAAAARRLPSTQRQHVR